MTPNPILDELYRIRDEYAASFNYDLDAIFEDLRTRQTQDGRELVSFPPRRPKGWIDPTSSESLAK